MVAIDFAMGDLETVAWDMIDHFMDGSGDTYSNETLTSAIVSHSETTDYTSSVQTCIAELLNDQDGNMSALLYSATNRDNSLLVNRMKDKDIYSPVYNSLADIVGGLTICVDSLWGVKIEVIQYSVSGSTYTCELHYTFYDHFGLDEADVEKYGYLDGFKDWFILQHYSEYNGAYRPFLTLMEFDVTFTGTIS